MKSILFGIFKVNGWIEKKGKYYYKLEELDKFKYLLNRIIIDWGGNALAWHQWYDQQPKEIIQILPKGYLGDFLGLLNFILDFNELERLIKNPEANEDWKNHLSSVNGIYLILDDNTGKQYIGSANGKVGIWQRWEEYANTFHGGNKKLIKICNSKKDYHKNFRYSVLQSLPSNITQKEIIKIENLYKEKLGTKAHGLN